MAEMAQAIPLAFGPPLLGLRRGPPEKPFGTA
jgi:hypothetical protein